jgi:hypothetical protein
LSWDQDIKQGYARTNFDAVFQHIRHDLAVLFDAHRRERVLEAVRSARTEAGVGTSGEGTPAEGDETSES